MLNGAARCRRLEILTVGGWPARHLVRSGRAFARERTWNQAEHHHPPQRLVCDLLRARGDSAERRGDAGGRPDQWSGWSLAVAASVRRRSRRHTHRDTSTAARGQTIAPEKHLLARWSWLERRTGHRAWARPAVSRSRLLICDLSHRTRPPPSPRHSSFGDSQNGRSSPNVCRAHCTHTVRTLYAQEVQADAHAARRLRPQAGTDRERLERPTAVR